MLNPLPIFALFIALAPTPQEGLRTVRAKDATIKSNASPEITKRVADRIDRFCDLFETFYKEFRIKKKNDNKMVVRLFDSFDEYQTFAERNIKDDFTAAAFFSRSLNTLVLYNDEADIYLRQTLFHESSHQYLNRFTYDAPKWLNEGLAEYFEGWKVPDDKPEERRVNLFDLTLLQDALRSGKFLAPEMLVKMSAEDFMDFAKKKPADLHRYLHYATSWGLVYYCLSGGNVEDRKLLVDYVEAVCNKGAAAKFDPGDWRAFETRWKDAMLKLSAQPKDGEDQLLLAAGFRESQEWKNAVERYQMVLTENPKTPGVSYWLGFCFKRGGAYEQAVPHLEAASTEELDSPRAPYQLARIALGKDRKDSTPDPPRAVKLATEASKRAGGKNPFYLSFLAECQVAAGDYDGAAKNMNQALRHAEPDEREAYQKRLDDLKKQAKAKG